MKKRIRTIGITLVIMIIVLEVGLRLFGLGAFSPPEIKFVSNPPLCFRPDSTLGIALNTGTFEVTLGDSLKYTATHDALGNRTTGDIVPGSTGPRPRVHFYGCSYTYGMGVDDDATYPYLLQQEHRHLQMVNRAAPGYGQVQMFQQLHQDIASGNKPAIAVFNYMDFHDERNTMNAQYRQKVWIGYNHRSHSENFDGSKAIYPYAVMGEGGGLEFRKIDAASAYSPMPLRNFSAIMNQLGTSLDMSGVDTVAENILSMFLLQEIVVLCHEHEIYPVFTYMIDDEHHNTMSSYCESMGFVVQDVSVDFSDKTNTNLPYDDHPSPQAHKLIAEKLKPVFAILDPLKTGIPQVRDSI